MTVSYLVDSLSSTGQIVTSRGLSLVDAAARYREIARQGLPVLVERESDCTVLVGCNSYQYRPPYTPEPELTVAERAALEDLGSEQEK